MQLNQIHFLQKKKRNYDPARRTNMFMSIKMYYLNLLLNCSKITILLRIFKHRYQYLCSVN